MQNQPEIETIINIFLSNSPPSDSARRNNSYLPHDFQLGVDINPYAGNAVFHTDYVLPHNFEMKKCTEPRDCIKDILYSS